jgi:hypothetical protein
MPERDAASGQVVGGQFDDHAVAWQDTDVVLPHPPTKVPKHLVTILQLNLEHRVWERFENLAFHGDRIRIGAAWTLGWRRSWYCRADRFSCLLFLYQNQFPLSRIDRNDSKSTLNDHRDDWNESYYSRTGAIEKQTLEPVRLPHLTSHGESASSIRVRKQAEIVARHAVTQPHFSAFHRLKV